MHVVFCNRLEARPAVVAFVNVGLAFHAAGFQFLQPFRQAAKANSGRGGERTYRLEVRNLRPWTEFRIALGRAKQSVRNSAEAPQAPAIWPNKTQTSKDVHHALTVCFRRGFTSINRVRVLNAFVCVFLPPILKPTSALHLLSWLKWPLPGNCQQQEHTHTQI